MMSIFTALQQCKDRIPEFPEIDVEGVVNELSKEDCLKTDPSRSHGCADFGACSERNTTDRKTDPSTLFLAKPQRHAATKLDAAVLLLHWFSQVLKILFPWISLYQGDPERQRMFAEL